MSSSYRETKELVSQEEEAYNASTMREASRRAPESTGRSTAEGRPTREGTSGLSLPAPERRADLVLKVARTLRCGVQGRPGDPSGYDKLLDYFARNRDLYPRNARATPSGLLRAGDVGARRIRVALRMNHSAQSAIL